MGKEAVSFYTVVRLPWPLRGPLTPTRIERNMAEPLQNESLEREALELTRLDDCGAGDWREATLARPEMSAWGKERPRNDLRRARPADLAANGINPAIGRPRIRTAPPRIHRDASRDWVTDGHHRSMMF